MTARKFTLTLNRSHKIAARLSGLAQETGRSIQNLANPLNVTIPAVNLTEKLAERKEAFTVAYAKFERLTAAVRVVRDAIGKANAQAGVSELLSEQTALSAELGMLKQLMPYLSQECIEANEVPADGKPDAYGRVPSVMVYALPKAERGDLAVKVEKLQARAHGVADKVADANRFTVTFDLDEDFAEAVGL